MCVQYVRRARIDKRGPGRALIARGDILAFSIAFLSCEFSFPVQIFTLNAKILMNQIPEISRLI